MFVIVTPGSSYKYHVNDVETGADVILGLTGDDKEYERSRNIMGNMLIGDIFDSQGKYTILCVNQD